MMKSIPYSSAAFRRSLSSEFLFFCSQVDNLSINFLRLVGKYVESCEMNIPEFHEKVINHQPFLGFLTPLESSMCYFEIDGGVFLEIVKRNDFELKSFRVFTSDETLIDWIFDV